MVRSALRFGSVSGNIPPVSNGVGDDRGVDFDAVRKNAKEAGISLSFITIKYENLTDDELDALTTAGLLTHARPPRGALGRFAEDGTVLFPEKAVGVLSLLGE